MLMMIQLEHFFLIHWHHTPNNNAIIDFPFFGAQVHILKTNIEYLLCPWLPCFWKTIQPLKTFSILKSSETCIQAPLSFYPTKYLSQRNEYKRIWMAACSTRGNKNAQGYQDHQNHSLFLLMFDIPICVKCLIPNEISSRKRLQARPTGLQTLFWANFPKFPSSCPCCININSAECFVHESLRDLLSQLCHPWTMAWFFWEREKYIWVFKNCWWVQKNRTWWKCSNSFSHT